MKDRAIYNTMFLSMLLLSCLLLPGSAAAQPSGGVTIQPQPLPREVIYSDLVP
jgi:hypothetical protein